MVLLGLIAIVLHVSVGTVGISALVFSMASEKRKNLTVDEKIDALLCIEKGEKKSVVAKRLGIPANTLSTWIKNKDKIMQTYDYNNPERKRQRLSAYTDVEHALLEWFKQARSKSVAVSGPLLTAQAQKFAEALGYSEFQCSSGWLDRFKQRNGITFKCITGESAAVTDDLTEDWKKTSLPMILQQYAPRDIYNMDETGLFFRMTPDRTLTFKGDACHGGKKSKERITVAVCANMDGSDKMQLLVIGKFQNPRCFKNVKSLPVQYFANRKAWMVSEIFEEWLRKLDRKFSREHRKVLMLVDNCPAHPSVSGLKAITLKFLPPNTTSHLQPMDQGIIQNMKVFYRKLVVERVIREIEAGREVDYKAITVLDAIRMVHSAWHHVKPETIAHCFEHAGFSSLTMSASVQQQTELANMSEAATAAAPPPDHGNIWERLRAAGIGIPEDLSFNDFADVDDEVSVAATRTDSEIVAAVRQLDDNGTSQDDDADDDVDDELQPPAPPTSADVINALAVINRWMESQSDVQQGFELVAQLEELTEHCISKSMKQATIEHYFQAA